MVLVVRFQIIKAIVEVMNSEFSGRNGPLTVYLLPSTKGTMRKIWQ
jgi:hypothetical protein